VEDLSRRGRGLDRPLGKLGGNTWGMFTGDDEAVRVMSGRIVEHMDRLRARNLLWPE